MGIYYLDTEYTNGNYYTGDIFEIALLSEKSGYAYHSYINVQCTIPTFIKNLCSITDAIISESSSFCIVIEELVKFITTEELNSCSSEDVIIIAHGGYLSDFQLLIVNCMKHNFNYHAFDHYKFIDSMKLFQDLGYSRAGLDALYMKINGERRIYHSAISDVMTLQNVVTSLIVGDLIPLFRRSWFVLHEVLLFLEKKLPISVEGVKRISISALSHESFKNELVEYTCRKTALSMEQLPKIVEYYFKIQ